MFTGIVEATAAVSSLTGLTLCVARPDIFDDVTIGSSIAVNGVCLTVTTRTPSLLGFDLSAETLEKSTMGELSVGSLVNLERSVPMNGRLEGHIVQGHIEGRGRVLESPDGWLKVSIPPTLSHTIVEKGSICLHGVSLTVVSIDQNICSVMLIPHTRKATVLGMVRPGDTVNIETDIIGRYLRKFSTPLDSTHA